MSDFVGMEEELGKKSYKKVKEEIESSEHKEKALKAISYLLTNAEKYSAYFVSKLYAAKVSAPEVSDTADAAVVPPVPLSLTFLDGGELRDYQTEGVHWLASLFENGINGILADEMGLGKTVQVIGLVCHLLEQRVAGPYLIVAPLSTLPNWISEWQKFAAGVPVVLFHGSRDERRALQNKVSSAYMIGEWKTRPIVLTSYETVLAECAFLQRFRWQYVIVDEGHRIKNHESKLSLALRSLISLNRLLLTGTPLQNNLRELWALLNFLMPHFFSDADAFASLLATEELREGVDAADRLIEQERQTNLISSIHRVLAPFMLRRVKTKVLDATLLVPKRHTLVYCPLSHLQRDLYTYILQGDIKSLQCEAKSRDVIRCIKMANPMMMLKKVVNHPYLVHFPVVEVGGVKHLRVDEDLVLESGKFRVLDMLLRELQRRGHKTLVFSTLTTLLDLAEEMLLIRELKYVRLDGSHRLEQRQVSIHTFTVDPSCSVFLISTRAGGLGLNLTAADTVVLLDQDWNPQVDLQAQDRCHRLGQMRPVRVYSLVTRGTIDEHILRTGACKRRLEKLLINDKSHADLEELRVLLQSTEHDGAALHADHAVLTKEQLDNLLDRSDMM